MLRHVKRIASCLSNGSSPALPRFAGSFKLAGYRPPPRSWSYSPNWTGSFGLPSAVAGPVRPTFFRSQARNRRRPAWRQIPPLLALAPPSWQRTPKIDERFRVLLWRLANENKGVGHTQD